MRELNYRLVWHGVLVTTYVGGLLTAAAYLIHVVLSAIFGNPAVLLSLLVLGMGLGIYVVYDPRKIFDWNNTPPKEEKPRRALESSTPIELGAGK